MISPARRVSFDLLCQIDLEGLHSDDAVNSQAVARLELRDRPLATELIMGTLRWQGLLDHVLALASSRPWPKVDPRIKVLLRMSLHQMWQMNRIPDHALVNDAVEMAKRWIGVGAGSFLNAILRRLARERPWQQAGFLDSLSRCAQVSLPRWLWERWATRFGETAAREYALSLNETPQMAFRIPGRPDSTVLEARVEAVASDLVPGAYVLKGEKKKPPAESILPVRIQDEASQLIPHLLGEVAGWSIWDACAAPGGKSAILCENTGKTGFVVSSDLSWQRSKALARTLSGFRGSKSGILVLDARKTPSFRKTFDGVIADVPCSGLGTLRRNPDIKWRFRPEQLPALRSSQEQILNSVSDAVRRGGYLLYSTCSTEPEENEEVVLAFLACHTEFKIMRPSHPAGVEALLDESGLLRTFPMTRLWDGFFAALMLRNS